MFGYCKLSSQLPVLGRFVLRIEDKPWYFLLLLSFLLHRSSCRCPSHSKRPIHSQLWEKVRMIIETTITIITIYKKSFQENKLYDILGQFWVLQDWVSLVSPEHSAPPKAAAVLTPLCLVWVPPSHDFEHVVKFPQSANSQLTRIWNLKRIHGNKNNNCNNSIFMKNILT